VTSRVSWHSLPRLPKCPFRRSDGRSQGRPQPARAARAPLTAGRSEGYSLLVRNQPAYCVRFDRGNSISHFGSLRPITTGTAASLPPI
jgi:hypothetical protein